LSRSLPECGSDISAGSTTFQMDAWRSEVEEPRVRTFSIEEIPIVDRMAGIEALEE
jgi:hypothetical protein